MDAVIPCVCPDARHETDTITFRERLDFRSGLAIRKQLGLEKGDDPGMGAGEVLAILTESYLVYGIESWTLTDERGKPLDADRTNIRRFLEEHPEEATAAGDVADELYSEQVLLPLLQKASNSSRPSRTPKSTSATRGSSGLKSTRPKPKQSRPSLTSITPTGDTAPTTSPPDGDSKSLRNSA